MPRRWTRRSARWRYAGPGQRALGRANAHPRLFNLTVSSVPGPAVPRYVPAAGWATVHSAVPLSGRHALSIGVVDRRAATPASDCSGTPDTLPDADALGGDLDAAFDELVEAAA